MVLYNLKNIKNKKTFTGLRGERHAKFEPVTVASSVSCSTHKLTHLLNLVYPFCSDLSRIYLCLDWRLANLNPI